MRRLAFLLFAAAACRQPDPPAITAPWRDDFERTDLGGDYAATADSYAIVDGALRVANAYNHPLWLRKKLPPDAIIEFDVWSKSPQGDIKVEIYGDGVSHAHDKGAYTSSGYVLIHGGWSNSKSILAKGNEHGTALVERTQPKVELGRRYHWKIVRHGGKIDWFVDDMTTPFLSLEDTEPLGGAGHSYFGFNDWEAELGFDNLEIRPIN
jgi:hypothetical protein